MICSEPFIAQPRSDQTYSVIFDASTCTETVEGRMGAILAQIDKKWKTLCNHLCLKQQTKHKNNYSPLLLEMDAVVWPMKYYQEHMRGRRFILYTELQST
jgi:hypothetical protein